MFRPFRNNARRKLILHIGANKTGSSAIQKFLSINNLALREEGIIVPNKDFEAVTNIGGNHVFTFASLLDDPPEGRKQLEAALDVIDQTHPKTSAILLSAENLSHNPDAPSLFRNLVRKYEVEVIVYIRRQDDYILSSWQQWNSKVQTDFWAWVLSVAGTLGDWRTYLKNWETVVPRENITVRVYERSKLAGKDVISDFYQVLGCSRPFGDLDYPKDTVNPSFSDAIMDLVKGNDLIFRNAHDNDFYNFVREMTGDRYTKTSRQSSISFPQRLAILEKYREQNAWVKKNYFPSLGEKALFSPPRPGDYHHVSPEEADRQKLEFLTTMLYQMYKRGRT